MRLSLGGFPRLLSGLLLAFALPGAAAAQLLIPETTPGGWFLLIGGNPATEVSPSEQCLALLVKPDDVSPAVSRNGYDMRVQERVGPIATLTRASEIMEERGFSRIQHRWWASSSGCTFVPFALPSDWMTRIPGQYVGTVGRNTLVMGWRLGSGQLSAQYRIIDVLTGQVSAGTLEGCRIVRDSRTDPLKDLRVDCELRGGAESGVLRTFFRRPLDGFDAIVLGQPGCLERWRGIKR